MLKTIEQNGIKIIYDKEKTEMHLTEYNQSCDCQDCRNFYENVKRNTELTAFLEQFGVHYKYSEEIFSWTIETPIHSEVYYGVYGVIDGEDISFEKFGVKISFTSQPVLFNHDRCGDYFWIVIEADFPYILDEPREIEGLLRKESLIDKIKAMFKR